MAKKKSVTKRKSQTKGKSSPDGLSHINSRLRKSNLGLIYSIAVFIVSLVLYLLTTDFLESLFGFIMIISGALFILFGIVSIILYLVKRRN